MEQALKVLKVILRDSKGQRSCFYGNRAKKEYYVISAMKYSKLLKKGCIGYWYHALEDKEEEQRIENILVVCEFYDVFPKKLSELPS